MDFNDFSCGQIYKLIKRFTRTENSKNNKYMLVVLQHTIPKKKKKVSMQNCFTVTLSLYGYIQWALWCFAVSCGYMLAAGTPW